MTNETKEKSGFWSTFPGLITKITALVVALGSLVTVLSQTGIISKDDSNATELTDGTQNNAPFFIICDTAYDNKDDAKKRLVALGDYGYNGSSAYLWVPDYDCLSDANMYQVYVGPFSDLNTARAALCDYNNKFSKTTYGLKICDGTSRFEFRCSD